MRIAAVSSTPVLAKAVPLLLHTFESSSIDVIPNQSNSGTTGESNRVSGTHPRSEYEPRIWTRFSGDRPRTFMQSNNRWRKVVENSGPTIC